MHRGMHRASTLEQFRPVNLPRIEQDVRVQVSGHREVALAYPGTDLCPRHALSVEERDPPMAKVVWRPVGYAGVPTRPVDSHP